MKILIVGGGGREHALAWKVAQSPRVTGVYVAPGNPGTAREAKVQNVALDVLDFEGLCKFARETGIALTIVGPEVPLVAGIRDFFDAQGLACFGPSRAAAQLEGSKQFTKAFLVRHRIPTAAYRAFTDPVAAEAYVRERGAPIVVKADGLAAGKGVVVARTVAEALAAVRTMLSGEAFGAAGRSIVIEDCLVGEEASFICIADGRHAVPFATSQDHKARDDGDLGPNTGGLGAYSPAPVVTPRIHEAIMERVIRPTVAGLAAEGTPYVGFLYAGLMIAPDGTPNVIEFNCRFGDPEAQPILARLDSDLVQLCEAALSGRLDTVELRWDPRVALGVVMAAGGYPGSYTKGDTIDGLDASTSPDVKVFHAGTRVVGDRIVTDGGRVLTVVGLGTDVVAAQRRTYAAVERIRFKNAYYRRDIGYRAIARERGA
ncbi:MAG TPA: phosphoribosylamine--glycine ligase [Pseudomonadales bacterium]